MGICFSFLTYPSVSLSFSLLSFIYCDHIHSLLFLKGNSSNRKHFNGDRIAIDEWINDERGKSEGKERKSRVVKGKNFCHLILFLQFFIFLTLLLFLLAYVYTYLNSQYHIYIRGIHLHTFIYIILSMYRVYVCAFK